MSTSSTLRELFEERTATVPAQVGLEAAVARRVTRMRRRRNAGTALAAVLAVLVVVGIPLELRGADHDAAPVPALEQKVDGLPVWSNGSKLVASETFLSNERRSATLTFTPTSWSLGVSEVCSRDLDENLWVTWSVNGKTFGGGTCSRGGATFSSGSYAQEQEYWERGGVRLGEPVTLRFWLSDDAEAADISQDSPRPAYEGPMPTTRVGFGVYQRVDPAAYPLPEPPRHPQDLDDRPSYGGGPVLQTVDSREVGANATSTLTAELPVDGRPLTYSAAFVSPGQLLVSVNGTPIDRFESWGYQHSGNGGTDLTRKNLQEYGVDVQPGEQVTITVTASRFTDPGWAFFLQRSSQP